MELPLSEVIGMHRTDQQSGRAVVEYMLFILQAHQDAMATNPPSSKLIFRIFPVKYWD